MSCDVKKNIAKVSTAHIPPAVAIRDHTTLRQKTDYRKRYTSSHQLISQAVPEKCFDRNFHLQYTGVTDGKTTKWKKEWKNKH